MLKQKVRQLLKHCICTKPGLFRLWITLTDKRRRDLIPNKATAIVIEGYPRSGNTHAVVAFCNAGNALESIAHHCHVPATVLYACARSIPAIVLVREPGNAVASTMMYTGKSAETLLKDWIWYYEKCWPLREKILLVEFEEVIGDFETIIVHINKRFGTNFVYDTEEKSFNLRVRKEITEIARQRGQGVEKIAIPTETRNKVRSQMIETIMRDEQILYRQAEVIYSKYVEYINVQRSTL